MHRPRLALGALLVLLIIGAGLPLALAAPVTVATTTNIVALENFNQVKSFYGQTKYWQWWSDGTNMVYANSSDGTTWSVSHSIRACTQGGYFSIYYDSANNKI